MGGSDKDREGLRDLMRGRSTASRSSPAKRQPTGSSSPIVSNDNGDCSGGDGVDANVVMVRWKKEVRASRWRLSNNEASGEAIGGRSEAEDGDPFRPMLSANTTTSLTSRKRVRLHGKVVEDSDAVDPAPVPRKLRSAINKRSQSSSPAMPDAKKKHRHTSNGLQVLYGNGGRTCKQSMLLGSFTKDEEVVVEALCALSRMLPVGEQIPDKEDERVLEDHLNNTAISAIHSEALAEVDKNLLQQCTANGIRSPSSCMEMPLEETMKDEHGPSKQPATVHGKQTIDSDLNRTTEPGNHMIPLSENEHSKNTPFRNLTKFSSPSGVLPHPVNRVLHPTQYDAITAVPPCKSDMLQPNGCVGSTALGREVQQAEHNNATSAKLVYREGNPPPHIQSSSSNSSVWPGPATSAPRLISSRVDLPTKKVPPDVTSCWKKCAIHVFIGHLIKSYQEKEKKTMLLPSAESRSRDGSKLFVPANNEKAGLRSELNGITSAAINGSAGEGNKHELTNEILCNGRFMPAHQFSVLSEAKQKQTCDFLSLSAGGDASSSPNGVKSSGQLHCSFLHTQVPHHSLVPFPFPRVPYPPPYTEKLVAATTQQVQLQVPHFVGNPFYGPQMDNAIGNIQLQQQYQQQQMWQAHFAHYRPLAGLAVLQNERLHDSSASVHQSAQASSTLSPSPSIQMQGGSYHMPVSRQQQHLVNPSSSSSSSIVKPNQHQHQQPGSLRGSRFHHEVPNQLQLLCNTNRS